MNNLSGDLAGDNSLFELSYELMADIVPLLVVALAAVTILFLLFRLKPINIPAVVLFILSVVGISLDLIQQFSGNNISSIYLPKWFIFLIGQLSYSLLVGVFIWIVFSYYSEKKRTAIYKKRLSDAYDSFRENVIKILLSTTEESCDSSLIKELCDHKKFRDYFEENNGKRWSFIADQLNNELYSHRHNLLTEFVLLEKEISNILSANISPNEESYNHLCHMSECTNRLKLDYDHITTSKKFDFYYFDKFFMMDIWSILSQWNPGDGQLKEDTIKKTIEKI